jgi:dienelactone hydrolase
MPKLLSFGAAFSAVKPKFPPVILALLTIQTCTRPVVGQHLVEQELRIPAPGAGEQGLEALMVRPDEPGPHPLALINHGSPRVAAERGKMRPASFLPQAREFARRGWTTVIVMRRGFGNSGGDFAEDAHPCGQHPEYYEAGVQAANDLRAAIAYLSKLPEVDASRIISVGVSAGGFATVALTANPPQGLVAGISFAGGRGSQSSDNVCNAQIEINAFREFGESSSVPMLWVYAENDHFFGPQLAAEFYRAFTEGGGKAQFVSAGPFGTDGHHLFSADGIPIWMPIVDEFLKSQKLNFREKKSSGN